jgi:hypothetical protein
MYKLLFVALTTSVLAGCGGNVKDVTCAGKDWYALGYETAVQGNHVRTFDTYRNQCGESLEKGALDTYVSGYTKGIVEYCTYEKGYELGSQNKNIDQTCPPEVRSQFNRGYNVGLGELKDKMRDLDQQSIDAQRDPKWNNSDRTEN